MATEAPREKLKELIEKNGDSLYQGPRSLRRLAEGLLRGLSPGDLCHRRRARRADTG